MKRAALISVVVFTFAAFGASAQQGPGDGPMQGGGRRLEMLAQRLNLTADQKASWEAIESEGRASVQPLADQRRALRDQIETALDASNPDVAVIGTLMVKAHVIDKQLKVARDATNARLSALLTTDQKTQFERFANPQSNMR